MTLRWGTPYNDLMASPHKLFQDITAGKFKPAYYFFGAEDYRITEAEKFVARQFLPHLQLTTNYRRLDGKKIRTADLIAELSNFPMLGEKQVFVITDFQSYKPTEINRILALLNPPDPNRIVVFSSPSSKTPKKKSTFFTAVSAVTETVEFPRLTLQEATGQISTRLQKEGISIDPDALRHLTELVCGNKGALEAELAKLTNFKSKGESISLDDIKRVSAGYEVYNIFELADVVVAGQTPLVLKMIKSLLAEGTSPGTLTMLLGQHFVSLYLVKNGKRPLGRRDFLTYKFRQQAQKYDNYRLESIIITIAAADAQLRHQEFSPDMTLEMLAVELAGEKRQS